MVTKMDRNATAGSKRASRRRPAEILTADEVLALIRACSPTAPTGVRNRALIAVLWRSGLRVGEALALELRDVDLVAGTLRVRHGKGDKSRTVGLDEQSAALIGRWLDHRRALRPGARAPVLCTLAGATIKTPYIRALLPRLAARAGIEGKRVHAHGLRHTFAAELARQGTPVNLIRDALGHSTLAVTDRYLRDVAPQQVIDTMRQREWPERRVVPRAEKGSIPATDRSGSSAAGALGSNGAILSGLR